MELNSLTAISPIDGRYHAKTNELRRYFSEFALIKYRVQVEVKYLAKLVAERLEGLHDFPKNKLVDLQTICNNFSEEDARWIKNTEKTTNHDVKAVEYFVKEKMKALGLDAYLEFVHFGLTSQDINNTSIPLSIKEAIQEVYLPLIEGLVAELQRLEKEWNEIPMLARTHGQPASPTRLGKEIKVFFGAFERTN